MTMTWRDVLHRANHGNAKPERRVEKSDEEWQALLDKDVYRVTRKSGTEPAFSSDMCSLFEPGDYGCACCDTLLFDGEEKFESGTGWPSFTQPASDNVIDFHLDKTFGMTRVETTCSTCDAHLGHVFPDGPEPGGLRFCMNALALSKQTTA